jgi:hypothetical protein
MSDMIFDQWVIGGPSNGRNRHAVMRRAAGLPNAYTCSSLCGARGGDGVVRGSNRLYDPTAITDPCVECARKWAALFAPQIDGWTKTCASCETDKPVSQFHTDARTKDGLTKTCLDCRTAAKQAVKAAERIAERAAQNDLRQARSTEIAQRRIEALRTFQCSPLTPTFACTAGHVLVPVMTTEFSDFSGIDYDHVAWQCPCGTRVIRERDDPTDLGMVLDTVRALETISKAATAPTTIDLGASV